MDTLQKFKAISALSDASIKVSNSGRWYISQPRVEIGNGKTLCCDGCHAASVDAAVDKYFAYLTELPSGQRVVVGAWTDGRREYKWNGFMWQEIAVANQYKGDVG